ncbi:MAG: hypothetical protein DRN05_06925 [Thermoplasmata archaeon]|nr:MAG: hypothetical protein DRN05_06925 [Thermoplasmata archaeon]
MRDKIESMLKVGIIAGIVIAFMLPGATVIADQQDKGPQIKIGKIDGDIASVYAEISNIGDTDASDINWSISVKGGILGMINKTASDTIPILAAGNTTSISTLDAGVVIFGLGPIQITITANEPSGSSDTKTAEGIILLFYIVILNESDSDEEPEIFVRGDANSDGNVTPADLTYLSNYLYQGGPAPDPLDAGDVNDDENVDAADLTYLYNFLFSGGPSPPPPYPDPGEDPTP